MRKKIDEALGNWETESARVKQSIFEAKKSLQQKKVKQKRSTSWMPYTIMAALLAFTIGGIILWQQSGAKSGPVSSNETPTPVVVDTPSEVIPHEKTLQIFKYEYFYRYPSFMSEKNAELQSLFDVMRIYPTLYHMEKYNYTFPKDREAHYRDRAAAKFKGEMEDEAFKKYFTFINEQHGITEEDYIEHYLLVQEKFSYMQNLMFSKNVGLVDGGFPSGEVEKEYEAFLGISLDKLAKEVDEEAAANEVKKEAEISDAPLQEHIPQLSYGYNKYGELVISLAAFDPEIPRSDYETLEWILEGFSNFLYDKVYANDYNTFKEIPQLNRVNFHDYVTILEKYNGTVEQEAYAKEAVKFLESLENTIDMELKHDFVLPK